MRTIYFFRLPFIVTCYRPPAQTILTSKEPWLKNLIFTYFKNIERLSYSSITKDPYQFFTRNIVKKPFVSSAADYGKEVHTALQKIIQGQAKQEDFPKDQQKSIKIFQNPRFYI